MGQLLAKAMEGMGPAGAPAAQISWSGRRGYQRSPGGLLLRVWNSANKQRTVFNDVLCSMYCVECTVFNVLCFKQKPRHKESILAAAFAPFPYCVQRTVFKAKDNRIAHTLRALPHTIATPRLGVPLSLSTRMRFLSV